MYTMNTTPIRISKKNKEWLDSMKKIKKENNKTCLESYDNVLDRLRKNKGGSVFE